MDKIVNILVPFDFSESARSALDYAVAFVGRDDEIKITLAYISEKKTAEGLSDKFRAIEEEIGQNLKLKPEWVLGQGTLTEALLNIQQSRKTDLIIMGTHGVADDGKSFQTNTSELVLEADCPVLVVPPGTQGFPLKRIALVLGREKIDNVEDLGTLLEVARRFNAKVHVVTIEDQAGVYGYSEAEEKNEKAMEYYLENFYSEHVFIRKDDIVEGILEYAARKEIDLIAILPRNHARNSDPSKGRLTQELSLHSRIPLLAVD